MRSWKIVSFIHYIWISDEVVVSKNSKHIYQIKRNQTKRVRLASDLDFLIPPPHPFSDEGEDVWKFLIKYYQLHLICLLVLKFFVFFFVLGPFIYFLTWTPSINESSGLPTIGNNKRSPSNPTQPSMNYLSPVALSFYGLTGACSQNGK